MKLRPIGDRVILQYRETEEKTQSGIILPDSAKEKPQEAIVVAVGDGTGCEGKNVQIQVKEWMRQQKGWKVMRGQVQKLSGGLWKHPFVQLQKTQVWRALSL